MRAYGLTQPTISIQLPTQVAIISPNQTVIGFNLGQTWLNSSTGQYYVLTAITGGQATWTLLGTPGGTGIAQINTGDGGYVNTSTVSMPNTTNISTSSNISHGTLTVSLNDSIVLTAVTADVFNTAGGTTNMALIENTIQTTGAPGKLQVQLQTAQPFVIQGVTTAPHFAGTGWQTAQSIATTVGTATENIITLAIPSNGLLDFTADLVGFKSDYTAGYDAEIQYGLFNNGGTVDAIFNARVDEDSTDGAFTTSPLAGNITISGTNLSISVTGPGLGETWYWLATYRYMILAP